MNHPKNDRCTCTNCPGEGCQCGCRTDLSAASLIAAPPACKCGPACACESAEQGCLCGQ